MKPRDFSHSISSAAKRRSRLVNTARRLPHDVALFLGAIACDFRLGVMQHQVDRSTARDDALGHRASESFGRQHARARARHFAQRIRMDSRRERRTAAAGSGSHVLAVGIGSTHQRPRVLCRTPPSLFGTLWIAGNAEATVTPAADAYEIEGAHIIARTMGQRRDRHGGWISTSVEIRKDHPWHPLTPGAPGLFCPAGEPRLMTSPGADGPQIRRVKHRRHLRLVSDEPRAYPQWASDLSQFYFTFLAMVTLGNRELGARPTPSHDPK